MIILDACVLIAHVNAADVFHTRATNLLLELADYPFATSVVTIGEVLVGYSRKGKAEAGHEEFRRLGVEVLGIPSTAPVELAELRNRTGLRMPDCCVLYVAQAHSAVGVATFDEKLGKSAGNLGLTVYGADIS